ncbi:hypothetical protein BVX95_00400 [archaeon D22]|nr:hypothetical protein BVX95_00400 [archaeon D22]
MADNSVGSLRRSAVIMTYSPGAVADMRAGGAPISGVTAGLEEWDLRAPLSGNLKHQKIVERRLCRKLGKRFFRLPPVLEKDAKKIDGSLDESSLILRRFPTWLQCPSCELLKQANNWASDPGLPYRYCPKCSAKKPGGKKEFVIPVRFVAVCRKGHLDEFPWHWWVQHKEGCEHRDHLVLRSEGAGLAGLVVSCPKCLRKRSLDGAFGSGALTGLVCKGNRPWLRKNDDSCSCRGDDGSYRVAQRGASNLYYPVMDSALDIPPWTHRLEVELGDYWDFLADIPDPEDRIKAIEFNQYLKSLVKRLDITPRELSIRFQQMQDDLDSVDVDNLKVDEYRVFTGGINENDREFETIVEPVPQQINGLISQVVRVARLREVRVTKGFTRINPPFDPDGSDMAPISLSPLEWLPAIEVRGEGIFLKLNQAEVAEWESTDAVKTRAISAETTWLGDWNKRNPGKMIPYHATPRLLMIHSFAHALIRQLTLECGYSSASLRERLYIDDAEGGMCGILIYTATPDSDGTLGGLQRRAMPDLLGPTVVAAIKSLEWCSSDPLCISGQLTSPDNHSIASCHSCLMVPETSCELHNRFLDRALLVGTDSDRSLGYLSALL